MSRPPNVLFIIADDHQCGAMGAYGDPVVRTPTLDGLAQRGALFERCYIMGGCHPAVCVPSRAALLTGCAPMRAVPMPAGLGPARDTRIDPARPLLVETFRRAGWNTYGIGKWHNDRASFQRCFAGGDAIFFGGMADHQAVPVHAHDPQGVYADDARRVGAKFSTELFCDAAVRFLEQSGGGGEAPFFLYLALTSPHDPRTPPPGYCYEPAGIPLPPNFALYPRFDHGEREIRDEMLLPLPRTAEGVRQEVADYYGMISHQDAQIGRVLAALEGAGAAADTIVVYVSDHGLALGRHGLLGKQNVYEHSVRVPLLIGGPGIAPGRRVRSLAYAFDLFPTLCALAGVAPPEMMDGRSLVPALQSDDPAGRERVFAFYQDQQRMVAEARWKRIDHRVDGGQRGQLFDLHDDPAETNDRSGDAECAPVFARLGNILDEWWQQVMEEAWLPRSDLQRMAVAEGER